MDETLLDTRGLSCPLPVLRARKRLKELPPGSVLRMLASDPNAVRDVAAFCESAGLDLVESAETEDHFRFVIRKPG